MDTPGAMAEVLEQKDTPIERLRALLWAPRTSEKLRKVCEDVPPAQPASAPKTRRKGHGRRGAGAYTGAQKVRVGHPNLKPAERCPQCQKGKLYAVGNPNVWCESSADRHC